MDYTVYEKVEGFPYVMVSEEINECFHYDGKTARKAEKELKDNAEIYSTYYDTTGELRKRKVWIERY